MPSARRRGRSRHCRIVALAALGAIVAACSSNVQLEERFASATGIATSGATVAFESIDGPPPAVFRRLVDTLNREAGARQVPVVSRSEPATYRVRGYVSAVVERNRTSFGWVWDLYDADKRRVLRISGREPAAGRPRDAWSAADEQLLRRIARSGMDQMLAFLNAPRRVNPPEPAPSPRFVFASARTDGSATAGSAREAGRR